MKHALALTLSAALAASVLAAPSADEFLKPAPLAGRELPADQLYPQGRLFPFGFYSTGGGSVVKRGELLPEEEVQAALKRAKADGATLLGPQYELNHRVLKDARQHGMKANYMIGFSKAELREGKPSDEEIVKKIREDALNVVGDDALGWWNIRPEELRPWSKEEMRYLELAAKTIREIDPRKRPIWMYDPGHRGAKGMAEVARRLDMAAKGMYTNYSGMKDQRVWCRWTIEQELKAIAEANPKAIALAVPEMFQQPKDPEDVKRIPAWVRHDVYAAMVAGAQGVAVFSASLRANFDAHEAYRAAYGQVARELCGPMNLGQAFLFGQRRDDLSLNVLTGPPKVSMVFPSGGVREPIEYPSLSIANIACERERILILVNSSPEAVTAELCGLPESGVKVTDLFQASPVSPQQGALKVEFGAWGVRGFKVAPDAGR